MRASRLLGVEVATGLLHAADGRGRTWTRELPDDVVVDGMVADPEGLAHELRALLKGRRSSRVVLGMANARMVLRRVEVPSVLSADRAASAARFEVRDALPFPSGDVVMATAVVDDGRVDERLVLVSAADGGPLGDVLAAARAARLHIAEVVHTPLALLPLAQAGGGGPVAVVVAGARTTHLLIAKAGTPLLVRTLQVGTEASGGLADELEAELARIESFVRAGGGATTELDLPVAGHLPSPLVEGVRASIEFYLTSPGAERLDRLVLGGAATDDALLASRLVEATGLEVVPVPGGLDEHVAARNLSQRHAPLGLSLLPTGVRAAAHRRRAVALGVVLAAGAAAGAVPWTFEARDEARAAEVAADDAEVGQALLAASLLPSSEARSRAGERRRLEVQADAAQAGSIDWPAVIEALQGLDATSVTIASYDVGRMPQPPPVGATAGALGAIDLVLRAPSHDAVGTWLVDAARFAWLHDVTLLSSTVAVDDGGTTTFQVRASVSGPTVPSYAAGQTAGTNATTAPTPTTTLAPTPTTVLVDDVLVDDVLVDDVTGPPDTTSPPVRTGRATTEPEGTSDVADPLDEVLDEPSTGDGPAATDVELVTDGEGAGA